MRVRSAVTSVSWIPSDSVWGPYKLGFDLKLSHWDRPLPERIDGPEHIEALRAADRFRFANVLDGWAQVEDGRVVDHGFAEGSGLLMGATTVRMAGAGITFAAISLPTQRSSSVEADGSVTFRQTAGGRTGWPMPRPVPRPPFVRWQAPIVWTTLSLVLRPDGTAQSRMVGASAFPRHWVYGADGTVEWKSAFADESRWMNHSFGTRTPWGEEESADRDALVTAVETQVERGLSTQIMRGGARPQIRRLPEGAELTRQGEPGDELYLVLDGVAAVEVDGRVVAEIGPGAVVGERAILEGGRRTSTLRASTPLRVAVAAREGIDVERLRAVADTHRREDLPLEGPPTAPLTDP